MQEWLNWPAWKASKRQKRFRGSNPLLSANQCRKKQNKICSAFFCLWAGTTLSVVAEPDYREWFAEGVGCVATDGSEAFVKVEAVCLRIVLVHIDAGNAQSMNRIVEQQRAATPALFGRQDEKHFDHIVAQPHKGGNVSCVVTNKIKLHGGQVLRTHQRAKKVDVRLGQKMVGTAHGLFPNRCQFVQNGIG